MSPNTAKDILRPSVAEPVLDNFRETSTDIGRLQLFQYGCPDFDFDFDYIASLGHPSKNCDDGAEIGETGQYPPTDSDKSPSSLLDASSPSDYSYLVGNIGSSNGASHYGNFSSDKQKLSNAVGENIQPDQWLNATLDEDELVPRSPPTPATSGEFAQAPSVPIGWTYRDVLETVAFPPLEGPHLWQSNISKLATQIGMPAGSTGTDVVMFIVQVATAKNERARVSEMIRSIAGTAKASERQAYVARMVASTFQKAPLAALLGGVSPSVEIGSSRGLKRAHDEISSSPASEPGDDHEEPESSSSTSTDDSTEAIAHRPSQRPRYSEEDLYCRVDDCLWAFDDPRICMKHRQRHFPVQWLCPGPCSKSEKGGKFARNETLKRHLLFPRNAACQKVVLDRLGLRSMPVSGTLWLTPLRDGPDRPWELPHFQLTDLKKTKEMKENAARESTSAPSPAENTRRRRYK